VPNGLALCDPDLGALCACDGFLGMKLVINGEDRDLAEPVTLEALVERLGMKPDRVAVELNREIVPRDQWSRTRLKESDRLEIVHFVGGGSDAPAGVCVLRR
jgi:sulfur carrier protein